MSTNLSSAKQALLERRLRNAKKGQSTKQIERRSTTGPAPLSFAQQRLWFLDQLEQGQSASYNVLFAWEMQGFLQEFALRQSLQEIVNRHDSLRTTFVEQDGVPMQVVTQKLNLEVELLDLQELPETERRPEALRLTREESEHCFSLANGPLIRVRLIRLAEREHLLVLNLHHIISDGWSIGVFTQELASLYEAFSLGKPSPLPELLVQYPDFAVWQRNWLQGDVLEKQLAYWKKQLGGTLPVLQLSTDHPRPSRQTFKGEVQVFQLSKQLLDDLKSLCNREGVTLFMTLMAAYNILLYRYTGEEDILIGTPIANRNIREIENLIGFFVNTLVLRTDLSGQPTFLELLKRVQQVALDGFLHQDVPFEKLVEELQPDRDLSQSPLFKVMFALQNASMPPLQLPHLNMQTVEVYNGTSKFDLFLNAMETEQGLFVSIEYSTDLYEKETITRLMEHFENLLVSIVCHPEQKVTELKLLGEKERQMLLTDWNATTVQHPEKESFVHQLLEAQVEKTPDAVAIVFGDEHLTYAQLNASANHLACCLQAMGVGPDVLVGISMERSLGMIIAVLAVLKAGGAYVPLDPNYPAERVAFILEDSQATVLITQETLLSNLQTHQAQILCLDNWQVDAEEARQPAANELTPDHLAYVIYTSGSTGKPKGVSMPHRPLVNLMLWQRKDWEQSVPARTLQFTSLSFDVSFQEIFSTLVTGGTLVLITEDVRRDPEQLLNVLIDQDIERLFLPFVALQQLSEAGDDAARVPTSLREVITAGEQLQITRSVAGFMKRLPNASLYNHYGPSETHAVTSFKLTGDPLTWNVLPPIGRPIDNVQLYVLDSQFQPVPIGVSGELYIGGQALARGYFRREDLTAERFVPNPFVSAKDQRLYKTGDLVRYLADGNMEYLGRIDQQVKIRGYRIEIGEVETIIGQHPQVREVIVVPRANAEGGKSLVAYVVAEPNFAIQTDELRRFVKGKLPEYMVPSCFMTMDALPLTPSGKVDRRALPAPDQERVPTEGYVAPGNLLEEILAGIFCEVLGHSRVGVQDDFFDLGGHSLLATRVISRIRKSLQADLPVRALFEAPRVAQLAQSVREAQDRPFERRPAILTLGRTQPLPLSFSQLRFWNFEQAHPGTAVYNLPDAWRLQGKLNIEVLEQTLNRIRKRHDILRTTFAEVNGEPVQVIAPYKPESLTMIDVSALSEEDRETEVQGLIQAQVDTPFNLRTGPLFRALLIRCAERDHVLFVNRHHITHDGWSSSIFTEELVAFYNAGLMGGKDSLPPLPVQYADYAHWQHEWFQSETIQAGMAYWREKLGGNLPSMQLSMDRPRPSKLSYLGAYHWIAISKELLQELKIISRRNDATLFMTLMAIYYTLLHHYTGQTDLILFSVAAGRHTGEVEKTIGAFANLLPFRTDISGDPTFVELLARVRETTLDAFKHQEVPSVKMKEIWQTESNQSPLRRVNFALQNTPTSILNMTGLEMKPFVNWEGRWTRDDLTLSFVEKEDGLIGTIEYSTELFDASTITRMFDQYISLAQSICNEGEQPISQLGLVRRGK